MMFWITILILLSGTSLAREPLPTKSPSFERHVVSILTKHGCNASNCHGGVKGRGGMKLSLDGLNPGEDYRWIVKGGTYQVLSPEALPPIAPRVNLQEPEQSLLLLKPTASLPHEGGQRFSTDTADYETILDWVRAGAPYGDPIVPNLQSIEATPAEIVIEPGQTRRLEVVARFADRSEDITREVRYQPLDSTVAAVTPEGVVKALQQGETAVILRWVGRFAHVRVGVRAQSAAEYAPLSRNNLIDEYVFDKLGRLRIHPSEQSSDHEFLRRVCLDLTGTLAPPHRVREFVGSTDPRKREKLIDTLLDSPEFVDFWVFRFSDLFRVRGEYGWILPFWEWVRQSVATNKPYDQMAREAIAVQGYGGPAHKHMVGTNKPYPVEQILNETLRVFMGRRLDCAQCHNHPSDRWTQNQYWGLAAFFGRMTNTGWNHDNVVFDDANGHEVDYVENDPDLRFREVIHPRDNRLVAPAFLDGTLLPNDRQQDPRMELARWMTSHPYFAEAAANRIWSYFFGRGLVDPVDDFRLGNPPTHPRLLEALASRLREQEYDLKHLMRLIVTSRAYQLSSRTNPSNRQDRINYSHALPRPLEPAVLLDAISQVTGVPEVFGKLPIGTKAIELRFPKESSFLDIFGTPQRAVVPEPGGKPSLGQALHMFAGATFNQKLSKEGGFLSRTVQSDISNREIIERLHLATLARSPAPEELAGHETMFQSRPRKESAADLLWALLTSREFCENH